MPTTMKERSGISAEIRILPWWAYLFTAISFAITLPYFYFHPMRHLPLGALSDPVRAIFTVLISSLIGFLILLIGYVNRDAKRRAMNSALWTALVIFIPNAIGFILYFLLRRPIPVPCPQCGAIVNAQYNFCPKCKYNLLPTCPSCQHAIQPGDAFCPYCAHELKVAET